MTLADQPALFAAAWLDAESAADRRRERDRIAAEVARAVARAKRAPRDFAAEVAAFLAARPDIATWLTAAVEACRVAGHRRIAVNAIVEEARRLFVTPIDNSWRAALADRLIAADPRLDGLIERRRRRVTR